MTRVFISYTRRSEYDKQFANTLRDWLQQSGFETWMDTYNIPSGSNWDDEVDKALKTSEVVLGIMSPASVDSDNVKNEWAWALGKNRLQLILLHPCDIPHRFVRIDYIDFTRNDPTAWQKLYRAIIETPTTVPAARSVQKRATGLFSAVLGNRTAPKAPPLPAFGQKRGGIRGIIIGVILGILLVCGLLAFVASQLADSYNPTFSSVPNASGSNALNAQSFLASVYSGNLDSAVQLVCPRYRAQIRAALDALALQLASQGIAVTANNILCSDVNTSLVSCSYTLVNLSSGLTEPLSVSYPMEDGLVCTLGI